jgi:hypothetical protein
MQIRIEPFLYLQKVSIYVKTISKADECHIQRQAREVAVFGKAKSSKNALKLSIDATNFKY